MWVFGFLQSGRFGRFPCANCRGLSDAPPRAYFGAMVDAQAFDALLDLERLGWASLCEGTGSDFFGSLMTRDGVMVLADGLVLNRQEVVASLREAIPWDRYSIADARLVSVGSEGAALVYTVRAERDGDDAPFSALMSSVYRRGAGVWRLALYQQTAIPSAEA